MSGGTGREALPSERAGGRTGVRRASRSADQQQAAAAGLDLLRVLGWLVLHDVAVPERPGCPIDHVVVGPSGVYVINDEAWSGTLAFRENMVLLNGSPQLEAIAEVGESAAAVRNLLGGLPVVGVLCLVRPEAVAGVAGDVAVCATENILDLLTTQPGLLDTPTQHHLSRSLRAGLRAVGPRVPVGPTVAAPPSARSSTSAPSGSTDATSGSAAGSPAAPAARHKDKPASRLRLRRTTPEVPPVVVPRHAASARPVQPVEGAVEIPQVPEVPAALLSVVPVVPVDEVTEVVEVIPAVEVAQVEPVVPAVAVEPVVPTPVPEPVVERPTARVVRAPAAPTAAERRALVTTSAAAPAVAPIMQPVVQPVVQPVEPVEPVAQPAATVLPAAVLAPALEAVLDQTVLDQTVLDETVPDETVLDEFVIEEPYPPLDLVEPVTATPHEYEAVEYDAPDTAAADAEAAELAEIEEARLALQAAIEHDRVEAERRRIAEERRQAEEDEARAVAERRREVADRKRLEDAEARVEAAKLRAARESAVAEQVIADRVAADRAAGLASAGEPSVEIAGDQTSGPALPARFAGRDVPRAPVPVADESATERREYSLRKTLMPAVVAALMVVVIAGVVPRVPSAIDWVQVQLGKTPTHDFGKTASVGGNTYHPALDLRSGAPVRTVATQGSAAAGDQLLAVPFRVQNKGTLGWSLPLGTKVEVVDALGVSHRVAPGLAGVKAGKLLPDPLVVSPGHYVTGYLPVELPAGRTISEVRIDLGGAKGDKVVWKAP